eukprot:6243219-Heterocapsa_arctica.AAC.1
MQVFRVEAMFKLTNKTTLERTVLHLCHDKPMLVWIYLFSAGTPRGTKRDGLAARALTRLVRAQLALGHEVIIDGADKKLSLYLPKMEELANDTGMKITHHR